jgi:post-segregation antitoxin (ccd killing protein)
MTGWTRRTSSHALGINASQIAEAALAEAVRASEAALLRVEIGRDMVALADYVAAHGDPAAELHAMFDGPDAACFFANPAPRTRAAQWHAFLLAVDLMVSLPVTALRDPLGSIAAHRDDITRAVDWLFTGI